MKEKTDSNGLAPREYEALSFIEQTWLLESRWVDEADLVIFGVDTTELFAKAAFRQGLINRGLDGWFKANDIDLETLNAPVGTVSIANRNGVLSGLQLAVINAILDPNDKRTIQGKCRSLGVNTQQYKAWLKDSTFRNYINARGQEIFSDHLPETHAALQQKAVSGDINAIKLAYELTGYYTERPDKDFDPRWILAQILTVLQTELDPLTLERVAAKLMGVLSGDRGISNLGVGNPRVGSISGVSAEIDKSILEAM